MDKNEFAFILGEINGKLESIPKIEKHLETLNGKTSKNSADIGTLQTKVSGILWGGSITLVAIAGGLAKRFIG